MGEADSEENKDVSQYVRFWSWPEEPKRQSCLCTGLLGRGLQL